MSQIKISTSVITTFHNQSCSSDVTGTRDIELLFQEPLHYGLFQLNCLSPQPQLPYAHAKNVTSVIMKV